MTYVEFQNTLAGLGFRLQWDIQLNVHTSDPQLVAKLDYKNFPLSAEIKKDRKFTLSDALALKSMADS